MRQRLPKRGCGRISSRHSGRSAMHSRTRSRFPRCFDVHTRNELSRTLAMEAAINNNKNILKLLHSYGADINLQDNLGNAAIHYACQYKHDELAGYMVGKLGANDRLENEQGYDPYIWGELH